MNKAESANLYEVDRMLIQTNLRLRSLTKIGRKLEDTQKSLQENQHKLAKLNAVLNAEEADVKRLEGLSLLALFYTILGSKEEQLEKERQEYLQAKLQFDLRTELVNEQVIELRRLKEIVQPISDVRAKRQLLLEEKARILVRENEIAAKKIAELAMQLTKAKNALIETQEASIAGKDVEASLNTVIGHLQSAEGWGAWDMFGGGLIVTSMKHSEMDYARQAMHVLQKRLNRFHQELKDITVAETMGLQINEFTSFGDFFFDGLIFDWLVQSKIATSLSGAIKMQSKVKRIISDLERQKHGDEYQIQRLSQEYEQAIEDARSPGVLSR